MSLSSKLNIFWSPEAVEDLNQALAFAVSEGVDQAPRLVAKLEGVLKVLVAFPASGRPGQISGTREHLISDLPFLIIYRVHDENFEVVRFYHSARQWPVKRKKKA